MSSYSENSGKDQQVGHLDANDLVVLGSISIMEGPLKPI